MAGQATRCSGVILFLLGSGCATYSQDLERARRHYQALEFPQALAVMRVLAEDFDGLSPAERVQFTYLRGMTDFRLADTVPPDPAMKAALRACARDWLEESLTLEKHNAGALTPEQTVRARVALAHLIDVETPPRACLAASVVRVAKP